MIEIGAGDIFPDCTVIAANAQIRVQIEWCNFFETQTFGLQHSSITVHYEIWWELFRGHEFLQGTQVRV